MGKQRFMLGIVLVAFFLLPAAVWASDVPEVTEEEYRFYLEMYGVYYLDELDFSQYTNEQLQQKIIEAVVADGEDYTDFLEYDLWNDYNFSEESFGTYTVAELERFMTRALSDDVHAKIGDILKEYYQMEVDLTNDTPQEVLTFYYQTLLEKEFQVKDDLSKQSWYALEHLYKKTATIAYIQETYDITDDLSGYSLEELSALQVKYETIQYLQTECGVTEDLSIYTQEALDELYERLSVIKEIQEDYGVTTDLSDYTQQELDILRQRLELEQSLRQEFDVTDDLSSYTVEELQELQMNLSLKKNEDWWQRYAEEQRKRVDIQINGEDMYFTSDGEEYWWNAAAYRSDVRPVMKEDRVYVPFRAVFEALGADVSYDAASNRMTAQRGNRTVSFVVGQSSYKSNGVTIDMEDQTFVQDGWTFVPVRFASQALGVAVGWDSDNRTVIILDREKLYKRYQGQFTVLEQYLRHWNSFAGQNVAVHGTFDLKMQMDLSDYDEEKEMVPMGLSMTIDSLTSSELENMQAAVQLDLDSLMQKLQRDNAIPKEARAILNQLKQFHVQYILDYAQGTLYVKSDLLDLLEGERNAWYFVNLQNYWGAEEYEQFVQMTKRFPQNQQELLTLDLDEQIEQVIVNLPVDHVYTVQSTLGMLQGLQRMVGDNSLGKTTDGYLHEVGGTEDGYLSRIQFLTEENQVTGLRIGVESIYAEDEDYETGFQFVLEEKNHVFTLHGQLDLQDAFAMSYHGQWEYTATNEKPLGKPNDSSAVNDLVSLFESWTGWAV